MSDEYEAETNEAADRYWVDVEAHANARARPAVPEEVNEAEIADDWILEIDGERELVTYEELTDRVQFEDQYAEKRIEIPIKELVEAYQYKPHQQYEWVSDETIEATIAYDPARMVVMSMDFDTEEQNGVTFEVLEEIGVEL
jgi:hypothetical protein